MTLPSNRTTVGELEHLIKVGADQKNRATVVALLDHGVVDEVGGSDVKAARGVDGHQGRVTALELASENDLLLVST